MKETMASIPAVNKLNFVLIPSDNTAMNYNGASLFPLKTTTYNFYPLSTVIGYPSIYPGSKTPN